MLMQFFDSSLKSNYFSLIVSSTNCELLFVQLIWKLLFVQKSLDKNKTSNEYFSPNSVSFLNFLVLFHNFEISFF